MHPSHKFMLDNIDLPEFYKDRLEWVFKDNVPAWERNDKQRVVSMASCILGRKLFIGNRHFCPLMQLMINQSGNDRIGGGDRQHDISKDQGFVDQYGVWMSRQEAYYVAKAARQLKFHRECDGDTLYSESYL